MPPLRSTSSLLLLLLPQAYPGGSSKEQRREHLAQSLSRELVSVPPSRLLTLLSQALQWQQFQGLLPADVSSSSFSLFTNLSATAAASSSSLSSLPSRNSRLIRFAAGSTAFALCFSPDGRTLLSGSSDGFLELWEAETGKLSPRFSYQQQDQLMTADDAVTAACWSASGELIASGSRSGELRVWKASSGLCLRRWEKAHAASVSSVALSRDGSQLLSSSHDGSLRLHGLKSGHMLREMRSGSGDVAAALFSADELQLLSAGSDGLVRRWDAASGECESSAVASSAAITGLSLFPTLDRLLVVDRSDVMRVIGVDGAPLLELRAAVEEATAATAAAGTAGAAAAKKKQEVKRVDWVCGCVSAGGLWVFGLTADSVLHAFDARDGAVRLVLRLHAAEAIALAAHPHSNMLASSAQDCAVKLWR